MGGLEVGEALCLILKLPFFTQQGGQSLGFVPGAGAGEFLFDFGKAVLAGGGVKDAPRGWRSVGKASDCGHEDH